MDNFPQLIYYIFIKSLCDELNHESIKKNNFMVLFYRKLPQPNIPLHGIYKRVSKKYTPVFWLVTITLTKCQTYQLEHFVYGCPRPITTPDCIVFEHEIWGGEQILNIFWMYISYVFYFEYNIYIKR